MRNDKGFTLIELSVVIVIIGLIVAGIVAGQALVKQARFKSTLTEMEKADQAIMAFFLQYDALPGDMKNAFNYWGASCDATASNCNGDGDKDVELTGSANSNESYRAWQHLSLANIYPGTFTGIGYGTGDQANIGQNVPEMPIDQSGVSIISNSLGNTLQIGSELANNYTREDILSAADLASIDNKFDDGNPSHGRIRGQRGGGVGCRDAGDQTYDLDLAGLSCWIGYILSK